MRLFPANSNSSRERQISGAYIRRNVILRMHDIIDSPVIRLRSKIMPTLDKSIRLFNKLFFFFAKELVGTRDAYIQ